MTAYLDRLGRRIGAARTVLCLGIDPDPDALPDGFSRDLRGVERMARLMIEAGSPFAAAVPTGSAGVESPAGTAPQPRETESSTEAP